MFRVSLRRQVRLSNAVARRQITTISSLSRGFRTPIFERRIDTRVAALPSKPTVPRCLPLRLYSSEAAAPSPETVAVDIEPPPSSGPVTHFADLGRLGVHPSLVSAITEGMQYENMTEVQSMTINPALEGIDLVAQAKTGTGKTLAFLVPVFQKLLASQPQLANRRFRGQASSGDIRAIIMSPTRELAEQIGVEARKLAQNTGIVVQTAVGGTRKRESLWRMQSQGCHVLVATPGRLQDLLEDRDAYVAAPNLEVFVLDEADRMLDVGFADDIRNILQLLPPVEKVDRQTLLFSATIPRNVVQLAKSLVKTDNFDFIQTIRPDEVPTHEKVPQHIVSCNGYVNWFPSIYEVIDKAIEASKADPSRLPFKGIVFFSNTASVEFAHEVFRRTSLGGSRGLPMFDMHSKLTQGIRTRNAEAFRRAKTGLLISSDVTARGMDFPNVSHVIQVGLPPDRDQYIHRLGRTGRIGHSGQGWLLLSVDEIREARSRLPGLPIKPNHTIESAEYAFGEEQPPVSIRKYIEEISRGYSKAPRGLFESAYFALVGQKFGRNLRVDDVIAGLNEWCLRGLGWEDVPAFSRSSASKRGLARIPGVRIDDAAAGINRPRRDDRGFERSNDFGRRSFEDRFDSQPGGRGFGRSGDRGRGRGRGRHSFEDAFRSRSNDRRRSSRDWDDSDF